MAEKDINNYPADAVVEGSRISRRAQSFMDDFESIFSKKPFDEAVDICFKIASVNVEDTIERVINHQKIKEFLADSHASPFGYMRKATRNVINIIDLIEINKDI